MVEEMEHGDTIANRIPAVLGLLPILTILTETKSGQILRHTKTTDPEFAPCWFI